MTAKKYKTLKTVSTLTNLNNIFKNSLFFCFIDAKCFNNKELISLKQSFFSLGLKMFIVNNVFLKFFNNAFKLYVHRCLWTSLKYGNLVVFYCDNVFSIPSIVRFFDSDVFFKKLRLSTLIFYFEKRFLYAKDFLNTLKTSKDEALKKLLCLLVVFSSALTNKLIFFIRHCLCHINFKNSQTKYE